MKQYLVEKTYYSRSLIRRVLPLFLTLVFSAILAVADTTKTQFNEANVHYEKGEYKAAVAVYCQLLDGGSDAAAIRFNLGNALYQSSQFGEAIVQYRKALALAPRDPDILANLRFVREKLGSDTSIATHFWRQFLLQLTINEWTILTVIPFWTGVVCGILSFLSLKNSNRWSVFSRISIAVFLLAGLLLLSAANERFGKSFAIVIRKEAIVRFGPFEESQSSHNLNDGVEVRILDSKDDWRQIRDPQNQTGWLKKDQIQILPTPP